MQSIGETMSKFDAKTHHDVGRIPLLQRSGIFNFLMMFILVFTLVMYMYVRNGLESLTSRNMNMRNSNAQLQQEIVYLSSELNDLSRPGQIQQTAKNQLGMVNSTPQADVIFVTKKR